MHNTECTMLIVCHYSEIAIKGGNRNWFENKLVQNIKERLNGEISGDFEVRRISGRILISNLESLPNSKNSESNILKTINYKLKTIFGIVNFSFVTESTQEMSDIGKNSWELVKDKDFKTFRITTKRSNKNFPMTSEEVNREIGSYIWKKMEENNKKPSVRLKNPDIEIFIEIVNKQVFIYFEKIKGAGGMPVGTGGKALTLLSGGIDSPVAAYYGLKRGVKMDFIHFHSLPYTSPASNEKVEALAKKLLRFQMSAKIFMIPFAKIQQEIVMNCPEKLRVIMYRRMMMKISEEIARKNKYLALYTGESVAQVASQTLENIQATNDAISMSVLRPLIGFDKDEIIEVAKKIDTYETSILPHEDCCTRFVPKHPETKADLEKVRKAEENLDVERLIQETTKKMEIKNIK